MLKRNDVPRAARGVRAWATALGFAMLCMGAAAAASSDLQRIEINASVLAALQEDIDISSLVEEKAQRSSVEARMTSALVAAERAAQRGSRDLQAASGLPAALIDGDRILVEIWHVADHRRMAIFTGIRNLGAEIRHEGDDAPTEAWVPAARLSEVASLPGVLRMAPARLVQHFTGSQTSQGVAAGNAPAWHSAGFNGDGVIIAIIDTFNNTGGQVAALQASGDWPPNTRLTTVKIGGGTFGNNGQNHGNAVLEIAYDVAPGATFIAYDTLTLGDWRSAIQQAIAAGADIISASLGAPLDGIGDGTALPGSVAQRVEEAAAAGVLYFNAAGNEREAHWGGLYNGNGVSPGGGWVDRHVWPGTFGGQPTHLNLMPYCFPNGYPVLVTLHWDDWTNVNHDYDLILYRRSNSGGGSWQAVATSFRDQNGGAGQTPQEWVQYAGAGGQGGFGCPNGTNVYAVEVRRWNAPTNRNLQVFSDGFIDFVPSRSLGFPADSAAAMTVAALNVTNSVQESYSSEGPVLAPGGGLPTGSEYPKPDFASFANVDTVSYGAGEFNGTSAAAPHAAGMAALLMQRHPGFDRDQIAQLIRDIGAQGANDLGAPGFEFQHGFGRVRFQQESALVVTQQPTDTNAGDTMASVLVELRDTQNLPVLTGPTQSVAVAIGTDPSSGAASLGGTSPVDLVLGEAAFSDLSIDTAGVGYTLQFSAGALSPVASAAFDILSVGPVFWTVTPSAGANGSIAPSTPQSVANGDTTAFTLDPDPGYSIDPVGGTCGGNLAGNVFTTNAVTADCTVVATFTQDPIDGVCGAAHGGVFTSAPTMDLCDAGNPTAVTGDGPWSWTCEGIADGEDAICSADIQTYAVTASVLSGNGSIGPGSQNVAHGGTASGSVSAGAGWTLTALDGDFCNPVADGLGGWSATGITSTCLVEATFTQDPIDGACGAAHGGVFTSAPTMDLCDAGNPTAVTGDGPWSWTCEGIADGEDAICSAEIQTWTLTYTAGTGGSISGINPQIVNHGTNGSPVEAQADMGYSFVQWSDNVTDNPRTDTNVTGDIEVGAEFAILSYVVTTTATNGLITSTIDPEVDHGQTAIVMGEAATDHYFSEVSGCGGVVQTNSDQSITDFSYETAAITAACEVTAIFLIRTESTTVITGIDPVGSQTVGQSYEVSVAVAGLSPSGIVAVSDGDANCDITLDAAGQGSCDLVSTTVGLKSITASYAGDGANDPSAAVPVSYDIVRIETSISDPDADSGYPDLRVGDSVVFAWTLDSASSFGTLDGDVSVSVNGTELCAAAWSEGACEATLSTGGPAVEFEFAYPGNTWYAPSGTQIIREVLEEPREITLDASIRKRVLASLVLLDDGGDLVRFELLVSNVGGDPIVGAEVVDMLPVEMVVSSWTCEEISGGECANASGTGDIDELVNLPLGASVRFLVEGLLDTVPEKGVVNTALVVAADDVDESNNASGAVYQRCAASNLQTDPGDETLLEHACVFRDGYEE